MTLDNKFKKLKKNGFTIIQINKISMINMIRKQILQTIKKELKRSKINYSEKINDFFFNNFHKIKIDDATINRIRLNTIKEINKNNILIDKLYKVFSKEIKILLGGDIVGQKNVNLVIHRPKDKSVAPIHRDSPPNSPHEIVFWLPLVDCYGTKSMNLLNKKFTNGAEKILLNPNKNYDVFENFFKRRSNLIICDYGQVLLFQTPVFHYIPINSEKETRFSLNFRFKNLNTKYGSKTFPDYFKLIKLSKKPKKYINA
tara:strand:- start:644 stop:1414 length:771 start_codon:yes stop_codon:yes gene_type:complete